MRHNLTVHYGVTHRNVGKFYSTALGGAGEELPGGPAAPRPGARQPRNSTAVRREKVVMESCLVCEEQVRQKVFPIS